MIQPLRTVHRTIFVTLALLLPAVLIAGLSARHRVPAPAAPAKQIPASAQMVRNSSNLWRRHAIQTEFYQDANTPEGLHVMLQPTKELGDPDLLLYWTVGQPSGDALPAEAKLLGTFDAGKSFALPPDAAQGGHLVLYSLAHQSIVDSATVEKLP